MSERSVLVQPRYQCRGAWAMPSPPNARQPGESPIAEGVIARGAPSPVSDEQVARFMADTCYFFQLVIVPPLLMITSFRWELLESFMVEAIPE